MTLQTCTAFKEVTGKALTPTFTFLGSALKWYMTEIGAMLNWFSSEGYSADILALKKRHPDLIDLKTWIAEDSSFASKR